MRHSELLSCPLCHRQVALTFHHLIPRKVHRRAHFKKHFSKQQLNEGIHICRPCHNGVHRQVSEMQLAREFNTLEALRGHPDLSRYFAWVARQRVRT